MPIFIFPTSWQKVLKRIQMDKKSKNERERGRYRNCWMSNKLCTSRGLPERSDLKHINDVGNAFSTHNFFLIPESRDSVSPESRCRESRSWRSECRHHLSRFLGLFSPHPTRDFLKGRGRWCDWNEPPWASFIACHDAPKLGP